MALALGTAFLLACLLALACAAAALLDVSVAPDASRALRGERATFTLTAMNRCVLPVSAFDVRLELAYRDGRTAPTRLDIGGVISGRSRVSVPVLVNAPHCGLLTVRVTRITARDPLGIWAIRKRARARAVACMPVIPVTSTRPIGLPLDSPGAFAGPDNLHEALARIGALPPDVEQVRPYRPGDPLHAIHWKLSARTTETLTKQYPSEQGIDALLLCDLGLRPDCVASPDDLDLFFGAASHLSCDLQRSGHTHALLWVECVDGRYESGNTHGDMPVSLTLRAAVVRTPQDVDDALCALVKSGMPYDAPASSARPDLQDEDAGIAAQSIGRADLATIWEQAERLTSAETPGLSLRLDIDGRLFLGSHVIARLGNGRAR